MKVSGYLVRINKHTQREYTVLLLTVSQGSPFSPRTTPVENLSLQLILYSLILFFSVFPIDIHIKTFNYFVAFLFIRCLERVIILMQTYCPQPWPSVLLSQHSALFPVVILPITWILGPATLLPARCISFIFLRYKVPN